MKTVDIKFKKLHDKARVPERAYSHAAAWDVFAVGYKVVDEYEFGYVEYSTGLSVEFPNTYVMKLYPRSSISKTGLILANSVGLVDPDYRGEITFRFKMIPNSKIYESGDKIGQLRLERTIPISWTEVDELTETDRGEKGYGSSGK